MYNLKISKKFNHNSSIVLYEGSCLKLLKSIPDTSISLIITSPPYNIGKEYEKRVNIESYIKEQKEIIFECHRVLKDTGNICWQVGNFVEKGEIIPIDILLYPIFRELEFKMRNRIIWHFEHGLHCKNRFSGRYETINWYSKTKNYTFNLDPLRVPQKYPGKRYFKGPKAGQLSCNPLGKNPGDLWIFPNVKNNHVEKTAHPCQFPVELVDRLVLGLSDINDWVFDPFSGVGSTVVGAIKNQRKGIGAEIVPEYNKIANERVNQLLKGNLNTRPMNRPVYDPTNPKVVE